VEQSAQTWGGGAAHAASLGEGNPKGWEKIGLVPVPPEWREHLQEIDDVCVAWYGVGPIRPESIRRVVGGACIHRSEGRFADLPIAFLWEILSIAMVAKILRRPATVLLPVAEECLRSPALREAYLGLGEEIREAVQALSSAIKVAIDVYWSPQIWKLDNVDRSNLYGLFYPFSSSGRLRAYPFGEPAEDRLLEANGSYCARYRHIEGRLHADDLVVEGIHVAQSILFGICGRANYLATVPLTNSGKEGAEPNPGLALSKPVADCPEWAEQILRRIFGLNLESLRLHFISSYFSNI
jgi:hypothetical protein